MKIAVLGTRGFPNVQGGIETHCQNLYPRLVEQGCEVTVFTRKSYVNPEIKNYKGVELIPIVCTTNKFFEAITHTFKGVFAAKKLKPDILHIHAVGPSLMAPLARILGMRVIMTTQGPDYKREKWGVFAKFVLKLGERLGSYFSNEVICVSKYIADDIKTKYRRVSHVIPNGVDIPKIPNSEEMLKKYSLKKGKYILTVGRFVPEKGVADLMEAFNNIYLDKWKLVIIGQADHESQYSRRLEQVAKSYPNIVLTGFLTGLALQELFSNTGLFVLPSYYEGLPLVLLEAMSYGLPCIVSDIPANRCVNLPENHYFSAGNVKQISDMLLYFTDQQMLHDEKHCQIGRIRKEYSWDDIANRTLEIYKKTLNYTEERDRASRIDICGVKIDRISYQGVIEKVESILTDRNKHPIYIVTPNTDHIVRLQEDPKFREVYNNATLVLPDGMPLLWIARLFGTPLTEKISGADLFPKMCEYAAMKKRRLFLLGGRPEAAAKTAKVLKNRYPQIEITGVYSPPFGFENNSAEEAKIIDLIKKASPDILFVGLGAPKQENWIYRYHKELGVPVSVGIGATFEFTAGIVKRAPVWMQKSGLEWFWRLLMEPRRLWKRYLIHDVRIVWLVIKYKIKAYKNTIRK